MNDLLEKYYCGNEAWREFAGSYRDLPNTEQTLTLKESLQDDDSLLLTKVIEEKIGSSAMEWIYRKIPALDNLRPIDCINMPNLLIRLKTMLMRMP